MYQNMDVDEGTQSSDSDLLVPQERVKRKIRRRRNPLSVVQKVAVIKAYERKPSVRALAVMFRCGRTQIKNILSNRNLHLNEYESSIVDEPPEKKTKISNAVEIVLHEWVNRALCYQIQINDEILRRFGCEIAELVNGCKGLELTPEWITSFRDKYGLTDAEMRNRRQQFNRPEMKKTLNVNNVVDDVRKKFGETTIPKAEPPPPDADIIVSKGGRPRTKEKGTKYKKEEEMIEPVGKRMQTRNANKKIDYNEHIVEKIRESPRKAEKKVETVEKSEEIIEAAKPISSYRDALNHLGPLEQFLLIMENIRAVGLVNQLENLFRSRLNEDEVQKM